jgi:hypothetical protein
MIAAKKASNALDMVAVVIPMQIKLHAELSEKLQPCLKEIKKCKLIVDLICDQEGLQTSGVVAGIRMVQSYTEVLESDLKSKKGVKGETTIFSHYENV